MVKSYAATWLSSHEAVALLAQRVSLAWDDAGHGLRVSASATAMRSAPPMATPVLVAAACVAANLSCAVAPTDDGLPNGRAEPRRPAVTACNHLGPGYVWAPASDTCLKVGGYVRVDGSYISGR